MQIYLMNFLKNLLFQILFKFIFLINLLYSSITRDSYLALSHDGKEKLIRSYYFDMKSRGGSDKFYFI